MFEVVALLAVIAFVVIGILVSYINRRDASY